MTGAPMERPIRIVHVIYRLDVGGMENGLVNLVNRLPRERYSHVILCLTHATGFRRRIERADIEVVELHKPAGKHPRTYWRVFRALRRLRPDIVHTRNLGVLDMTWVARMAGCPIVIHSEHGWSAADPQGTSRKYRRLRRFCDPAVVRYLAVSRDIRRWLVDVIGIAEAKVETLHNGVDTERFRPAVIDGSGAAVRGSDAVVFGTVGRQEPIKGLDIFLAAVRDLLQDRPELANRIRVIMAGDGPDHGRCEALRDEYGLGEIVALPGAVEDIAGLLRGFDFFVQPSLNEGISNTVLEAMASGLPVIATEVGGNPELVRDGREGRLIPVRDGAALVEAIAGYVDDARLREEHGRAARARATECFSLEAMARNYDRVYGEAYATMRPAAA